MLVAVGRVVFAALSFNPQLINRSSLVLHCDPKFVKWFITAHVEDRIAIYLFSDEPERGQQE